MKDNMACEIVGQQRVPSGPVLLDALVRLPIDTWRGDYPELMRLIAAVVEVDAKEDGHKLHRQYGAPGAGSFAVNARARL